jgi:hypothetical protein
LLQTLTRDKQRLERGQIAFKKVERGQIALKKVIPICFHSTRFPLYSSFVALSKANRGTQEEENRREGMHVFHLFARHLLVFKSMVLNLTFPLL